MTGRANEPGTAGSAAARPPLLIAVHERDNVAIVANRGGLPAGVAFPSGLVLRETIPQGHKVALVLFNPAPVT